MWNLWLKAGCCLLYELAVLLNSGVFILYVLAVLKSNGTGFLLFKHTPLVPTI